MNENPRERHVIWQDPMISANAASKQSGLEFLHAMLRGEIPPPPITQLLNFRLIEAERGRAVFSLIPAEYHYNPIGAVHGGVMCTVLDSAMGCAVNSTLEAGWRYTTTELHTHLIRGITYNTGELFCIGTVIHSGRRLATAEGKLVNATGKLYAHGTTSCMVFEPAG